MAKDDRILPSFGRSISKRFNSLNNRMDQIYNTTYASRTDNQRDLRQISADITDTLDKIIGDAEADHISDISNLYVRLQRKNGVSNTELLQSTMELFSDQNILNILSTSSETLLRSIQAEDYQYDLVCKYMPKLLDALDIKKDNILSSDNFTKEFMTVKSDKYDEKSINYFYQRVKSLKIKYRIPDLYERMVNEAQKYGECFVYCVPYDVALQRLLDRRIVSGNQFGFHESATEPIVVFESSSIGQIENRSQKLEDAAKNHLIGEDCVVNLKFKDSSCLESTINAYREGLMISEAVTEKSLVESYHVLSEQAKNAVSTKLQEADSKNMTSVFDKKTTKKSLVNIASDGLIVPNYTGKTDERVRDTNGAVVEVLDRGKLLPIYITNTLCVGYYYFEFMNTYQATCCDGTMNSANMMSHTYMGGNYSDDPGIDELVGYIAKQMSMQIDAHFINANKDLKEEIYSILRYNDQFDMMHGVNNVTVTFIPASDIEHFYFEIDPNTHRGISDLKKGLTSAMIWCMLTLTNSIGEVTRAQDKRIYYVKQNVETNVAKTLMNVINQLKKGNMGMRQISSMNSILSIVGKYNDHVIPVGQSGDSPVQFEVMSGQDIKTPTELMERYEESAIASTDVPLEFVQTVNQVDYATRFTMSNSKFLRKIYKRQRICQDSFSRLFTKIYNYEYNEGESLIQVMLPAPAFLTMTNTQQLINNTKDFANAIADVDLANKSDEVKQRFVRKMMKANLGSYLDYEQIDTFIAQAEFEVAIENEQDNE